jgi:hypothetical protein
VATNSPSTTDTSCFGDISTSSCNSIMTASRGGHL